MRTCGEARIKQSFTRPDIPKTNGKAERVIRTLMESWHTNEYFRSHYQWERSLTRSVNYFNSVELPKGIDDYRHESDYVRAFLRSGGQRIGSTSL